MTEDDRKMLARAIQLGEEAKINSEDAKISSEDASKVTHEMYRLLFEEGKDGRKSFFQRASVVVDAAESGSWAVKWIVRILLVLGAVVSALSAIWLFVTQGMQR